MALRNGTHTHSYARTYVYQHAVVTQGSSAQGSSAQGSSALFFEISRLSFCIALLELLHVSQATCACTYLPVQPTSATQAEELEDNHRGSQICNYAPQKNPLCHRSEAPAHYSDITDVAVSLSHTTLYVCMYMLHVQLEYQVEMHPVLSLYE